METNHRHNKLTTDIDNTRLSLIFCVIHIITDDSQQVVISSTYHNKYV